MIRAYRAELAKLLRPRVVLIAIAVVIVFAAGSTIIVLSAVKPAAETIPALRSTATIEALGGAGGGTQVFRLAIAFAGTFFFVVFVGVMAVEFSRGTIRTMLLHQPRRTALLTGKLTAMLTFATGALALTEVVTWIAARVLAPGAGVATGAWTSFDAVGAAMTDFGAVLLWITGYALLATALAVVVRSVPIALAIGIAWSGPIEHLVQNAWTGAGRWFPGLLLEAFAGGGTSAVGADRAIATVAVYAVVAAVVAVTVFSRRDVTS
jgi:ABC-type transport system involved in multi-copper enzyme maturation permease subunit